MATKPPPLPGSSLFPRAVLLGVVLLCAMLFLELHSHCSAVQHLVLQGGSLNGAVAMAAPHRATSVGAQPALYLSVPREHIPAMAENAGFTVGAELGVWVGWFAANTLKNWPSCQKYYLIDMWGDLDKEPQQNLFTAKKRLEKWSDKTVFMRNYTTKAALSIPDDSLDYIYVDARHDYCSVKEDLQAYWPKLRSGGLLAGHDYVNANESVVLTAEGAKQDWGWCPDGSYHAGAVRGAVDEFLASKGLAVEIVIKEKFPSWVVRKP